MKLARAIVLIAALLLVGFAAAALAAQLSDSDRRVYADAFDAAKRGDWPDAQRIAAAGQDPLPAAIVSWLQYTHGGAASFAEITNFIALHPDWPRQKSLRQAAESAIATATDAQLAPWFAAHPPMSPAARLREADMLMAAGRQDDANQMIRDTWVEGDFSAIEEELMLQRYRGVLRGVDNAHRLDRLIWDGRAEEAEHMLNHVGPETAALDRARLALAGMEPGVETLIARVPAQLQNDPGLLFERMRWRRRKNLDDDAADILEHPPALLGRPAAWASERLILARRLLDDGEASRAYRLAAEHGLSSGDTFAELEFLAGWIALRNLHQPNIAYNHFVRLYNNVKLPISVARGAYWAARAAEAMNEVTLADGWYTNAARQSTTYYGQLAAERLGSIGLAISPEPVPTAAETAAFEANELVRAARDLAAIGDDDDVPIFLRRLDDEARTPAQFALTARLARALDRSDIAVVAARRASYAGVTLLDEGYPLARLPPGGNIEAPLVLALTRQESAFDAKATSVAGALGLMQLMPATASKIARSLDLPYSRNRLTTDLSYNLTLGRAYLDSLIDDFSGSYVLAVAAYNAGPARVRQWMQDHGDPRTASVDAVDWVESIPIAETRNYVQRVLENLQIYRLRLGTKPPSISLAADLKR